MADYQKGYTAGRKYADREAKQLRAEVQRLKADKRLEVFNTALHGLLTSPTAWESADKPVNTVGAYTKLAHKFAKQAEIEGLV